MRNKSVLEIGAGTGRLGIEIRKLGLSSYLGIEPNKRLADYCKELGLNVVTQELPFLDSSFEDSFDQVISLHVLEHAPTYLDARAWVMEMIRVTKPGGTIMIACPDIRDYGSYFWDIDWSHGWPTSPQRVAQLLNDFNLEPIFTGSLHLGSRKLLASIVAHLLNLVIPTRLLDKFCMRVFARPLATGLKVAAIWGLTFVVAKKPI
jgi:SAM-dependent methyltransferase